MIADESVLTVGEWRNGLDETLRSEVDAIEKRLNQGFSLLGHERLAATLVNLLDGYDLAVGEIAE